MRGDYMGDRWVKLKEDESYEEKLGEAVGRKPFGDSGGGFGVSKCARYALKILALNLFMLFIFRCMVKTVH
ncbi:MAG: hypothetical protein ACUVTL_11195 [Thermoproteota archaeon]